MSSYAIPANTAELITAVGIPSVCLVDHHAVPHQTDLVNKLGVSSLELIARYITLLLLIIIIMIMIIVIIIIIIINT